MIYRLMLWNALKNYHFGNPAIATTYRRDAIQVSLGDKKYFTLIDRQTLQAVQTVLGSKEVKPTEPVEPIMVLY
ncbi:hypothetical protein KDA11_06370 [Candidatus Saccharibacteria bacterium]|nr:hypothetical protein [Candidatus Saccharibacteria bacterium]